MKLAAVGFVGMLVVTLAGQGTPVCEIVTEPDAVAVIGSVKKAQSILGPDQCVFTTEGLSLMVNRVPDQEPETIQMLLNVPKNRAKPGDVVKDEAGIGDRAVSEVAKGHLAIIAARGTTVWTFGVDHVYSKDISEMLPKLRALAQKVAR